MRPQFQFSLRSLFWLTAVVAVVLGTMTALGRTHNFRALGSIHAYSALVPIAAVWVASVTRTMTGGRLLAIPIALYLLSLVLPIFGFRGGPFPTPGFVIVLVSLVGPFALLESSGAGGREFFWLWLSCCIGLFVTLNYVVNLLVLVESRTSWKSHKVCGAGLAFAIIVLFPLGLSGDLDNVYIGYGSLVAAMLAMWLFVREERSREICH